ncbi:polysaccharide deacetylase family protein [Paludibacter jiangxiensis]|uniref:Sialate O-acetylesterase n=1 Tax=Paludibacter jiangxiensis TaxID=681398 RepID=A0A170ZCI6_9BACT|nr:polysaccharide deacetylase family protein [Paludibacter jiangxiensis]GAT62526.1 sialate O-acetylesterase [Paludibacter jiangxiensis]
MNRKILLAFIISIVMSQFSNAQQNELWNGKKCAVVLTYDDAIDVDLDNAIPALDSVGLKGTFYIIGQSPVVAKRMNEWRAAAQRGHELGNHTLTHPCDATLPGRSWLTPEDDLSRFSVKRAQNEIRITSTLLQAIDGKTERSFAYPCGDRTIGGVDFYKPLEKEFTGARGVTPGLQHSNEVDLNDIRCYMINGEGGDYMTGLVKQALESHTLLVFLFHGVGGGHNINVSLEAHSKLLHFLKAHENEIWIAPMVDMARYIREKQQSAKK